MEARSLYTFTNYSPEWQFEFEREAKRLQALLGDGLIAIHHIGSTSVSGLAAKPIIDLLPLVRNIEYVDNLTARFQELGYKAWGEYGLKGRRFFTKDSGVYRTHNVQLKPMRQDCVFGKKWDSRLYVKHCRSKIIFDLLRFCEAPNVSWSNTTFYRAPMLIGSKYGIFIRADRCATIRARL